MLSATETGKHPVEHLAPSPATLRLCCGVQGSQSAWGSYQGPPSPESTRVA